MTSMVGKLNKLMWALGVLIETFTNRKKKSLFLEIIKTRIKGCLKTTHKEYF